MADSNFPRVHVGEWAESILDWLTTNAAGLFDAIKMATGWLVESLDSVLLAPTPIVVIIVVTALAWLVRSWQFAIATALGFALVASMDQWHNAMLTLSLVIIAVVVAVIIAVPIGIAAARSDGVSTAIRPLLDFMQTMPAFVYLIPAIIFFGVGAVPGVFATVIFSLPPGVRFTELGIRQVDSETVEAGAAFGATQSQILRGIQIPLAIPTIMAGITQVIMLALSMAVIAGMVGADGLGKEVVSAISTQNIPQGVEAGLGVVVLAIFLDRVSVALGNSGDYPSSLYRLIRKRLQRS
ncbi:ABC transporter permease [Janibacter cremeus]|uniref:Glycine betaine/proline transport system permease protein n=1 Tax=Janibacter cremeus TaxID=1285192 RepID=A0A852VWC9_9MICO|nr:ABC transporter permease subunit [Janibacter cremeus]NYF98953.1 glycine betaine/proline transport system permease protein [Janibacter cremeus]